MVTMFAKFGKFGKFAIFITFITATARIPRRKSWDGNAGREWVR